MKKYAVNRLTIEIGRWCNMTCRHCYKGEREKMACRPEYIDKLLDNIYLVNHLYFCGGEASLYIDEMIQILEVFKKKKVPINHLRVNSNILIRSEKFVYFLNHMGNYSTHPEEVKLLISKDRFHLDNMCQMGIDKNKYEETKQWYRERLLDSVIFSENSDPHWRLILQGRALNIPKDELKGVYLTIPDYDKMKRTFIRENKIIDKNCKMENAFKSMMVSAEGYIFFDDMSYEDQRKNNHELSVGSIYADTLENLIKKWNSHCDNEEDYMEIFQYGITKFVKDCANIIDKIRKMVYENNEKGLIELKKEVENQEILYKKQLDYFIDRKDEESDTKNNMIVASFMTISNTKQMIDTLLAIPNGFWRKMGMKVIDIYIEIKIIN